MPRFLYLVLPHVCVVSLQLYGWLGSLYWPGCLFRQLWLEQFPKGKRCYKETEQVSFIRSIFPILLFDIFINLSVNPSLPFQSSYLLKCVNFHWSSVLICFLINPEKNLRNLEDNAVDSWKTAARASNWGMLGSRVAMVTVVS